MAFARIRAALAERARTGLQRQPSAFACGSGRWLEVDGRRDLNFASNDYLGLAQHPAVVAAWQQGARTYGVGSGGSAYITGHSAAHQALIEALCSFTGYPAALLFSSGFAANHGVLTTLLKAGDRVLQDRLNHASLLDGGLASGARLERFRHNDTEDLARRLAKPGAGETLIVSEGVFSMDGDEAPLPQLARIAAGGDAWLMIDDAHAIGVLGERGQGSLAQLEPAQLPLYMATFGKALGVGGAFVAGATETIDYLHNFCRHAIYTTAMPPAMAVAVHAALGVMVEQPQIRARLHGNIRRFCEGAQALGLPLAPSRSAIQPLVLGGVARTLAVAARLGEAGLRVAAIRPPTVAAGQARLRITLSASHAEGDVDRLLDALHQALKSEPEDEKNA